MANEAKQFTIGGVTHDVMDVGARQLIADLQTAIDAITSGDTTTAIKTFQEVINFLDGVTDDATLIGKLNELRTLINAKYSKPAGGIPASDLADGVIPDVSGFATKTEVNAKANSADVYDKQTVDQKVAEAGKVKSVSVNGGTPAQPDGNGNVNLPNIPTMAAVQDAIEEAVDDVVVGQVQGAVIDNFNSDSGVAALSAGKGKNLNDRLEEVEKYWNGTIALALVTVLQNMAFASESAGQTAANTIINAITTANNVVSIAATYVGGTKYAGDNLSASDFSVTATYGSGITKPVTTGFTFSPATLVSGSNIITITYSGVSTTVTVTAAVNTITAITGVTLKQGVVAPANVNPGTLDVADYIDSYTVEYANGTTETVVDTNIIHFASGANLEEGSNNEVVVVLNDDPTITYTITNFEASSATVFKYSNSDTSSRVNSVTLTPQTPLAVLPNKLTITSDGTTTANTAMKDADISLDTSGVTAGGTTTIVPTGTTHQFKTEMTYQIGNESEVKYTTDAQGRITQIVVGPIKAVINTAQYTFNFYGGVDYTFRFEEVSQS